MRIDEKYFYQTIRPALGGSISATKFKGMAAIIAGFLQMDADGKLKGTTKTKLNQLAYILATARHETGSRFEPIKEIRASRSQTRIRALQDRYWPSGYYGRGFVQITWKRNYEAFSKILGIDLVKNPELALHIDIATEILIIGMVDGVFTGHKLWKYINDDSRDFVGARRIVNGIDKAKEIAYMAVKFANALREKQ